MHPPTLADLPPAPAGRRGWPWTDAPPPPSLASRSDRSWPRVSIVTPSYNQAAFLEETIRSVLLQGYPQVEYIVMDGGSTDGSRAIIERYAPWIAHWVSERDSGQSNAINSGFVHASGAWLGWLNSDDCYAPHALWHLVDAGLSANGTLVAGASIRFTNGRSQPATRVQPTLAAFAPDTLKRFQAFDQPATLWHRALFDAAGPLDEALRYAFDWQFFIRAAGMARPAITPATVACYRVHEAHKTGAGGEARWSEVLDVYRRHLAGDDQRALARVLPWLGTIRWLKRMSQRFGRYGVTYYPWRALLSVVRRAVIDRAPRLHPEMVAMLELPYPVSLDVRRLEQGPPCDGTVAGALASFERG